MPAPTNTTGHRAGPQGAPEARPRHRGIRRGRAPQGGLNDLLGAAANRHPFDAVIVASIDRLSRMTADATRVERELEVRDLAFFAADEPTAANATAILTRRVRAGRRRVVLPARHGLGETDQ